MLLAMTVADLGFLNHTHTVSRWLSAFGVKGFLVNTEIVVF